jgi:hypothetical protein
MMMMMDNNRTKIPLGCVWRCLSRGGEKERLLLNVGLIEHDELHEISCIYGVGPCQTAVYHFSMLIAGGRTQSRRTNLL